MKIIEKISRKANDRHNHPAVTIAFLGDSITEGCFDVYMDDNGKIATYVDQARVYHTVVKEIFGKLPAKTFIYSIPLGETIEI